MCAAEGMVDGSLAGIAGMGGRLRQLALLGLRFVSDGCLIVALAQLPLLQVGDVHAKAVLAAGISGDSTTPRQRQRCLCCYLCCHRLIGRFVHRACCICKWNERASRCISNSDSA